MKQHFQLVIDNSKWSVGDGKGIYFWTDRWLDSTISEHWHIPHSVTPSLGMRVADCILEGDWCIPDFIVRRDAGLVTEIHKIILPVVELPDQLCWISAHDGILTNKIAYKTINATGQQVSWANLLWNNHIPPSRSFVTWRLIHRKIPSDENLRKRGCMIVSICVFCMHAAETSQHLFFDCPITHQLWEWLGKGTDQVLDCSSCLHLLLGTMGIRSALVKHIINSAIIHMIWAIWIERNQRYFNDKKQAMTALFNTVLAEVKLSYSLSLVKGESAMLDYKVAKLFNIPLKIKRFSTALDVVWSPPAAGVIKFNCDGSSVGSQPCGAIGVVLRDSLQRFLGAFSSNIGYATPLEAEFSACMMALEKAQTLNLSNICLETDSLRVVNAFHRDVGIPWQMRARWANCKHFCNSIVCSFVHVHREGNLVADALAKNGQGLSLFCTQWWPSPPPFLQQLLARDALGLPIARLQMT